MIKLLIIRCECVDLEINFFILWFNNVCESKFNKIIFFIYFVFRKKCFFVDLFVRVLNKVVVNMYRKFGYEVYRIVLEYYFGDVDEDVYGKGN